MKKNLTYLGAFAFLLTMFIMTSFGKYPNNNPRFDCVDLKLNIGDKCHDAAGVYGVVNDSCECATDPVVADCPDLKSTRLNSSHLVISYAVFCLKKKQKY